MQRSMRVQGLERLFDGSETGNECAAVHVISQPSKASYFADSYRLPSFMQSNTSFLSRADSFLRQDDAHKHCKLNGHLSNILRQAMLPQTFHSLAQSPVNISC